jgi:mannose-1-phosphate guanylyltransferase / mannose-6-phosphate isomerase
MQPKNISKLSPVILCGGAGTRLWPVSREAVPKPFMRLADGQSLLQKAYLRAASLADVSHVLVVTNREYYFQTRDEFKDLGDAIRGITPHFLLEPFGRNTAAAIALAAHEIKTREGDGAIMLVLPADHMIADLKAFSAAVGEAQPLAKQNRLVTFGIKPTSPEIGYGYIDCGAPIDGGVGREVTRFVEKPSLEKAQEYLAKGSYLWNSGMFCYSAGNFLAVANKVAPDLAAAVAKTWEATVQPSHAGDMLEIDAQTLQSVPNISVDYAVMERAANVAVVPCEFGWSDIGSWAAMSELVAPDADGNRVVGEAILVDSTNNYVQSAGRLVAAIGLDDVVIVDTPDAVLVAPRSRSQDVRLIVEQLKQRNHAAYRFHQRVHRPWGTYTVLQEGPQFKIKRIEVKPGASLSLQMHHHRSEHWIVVSGTAKVVNGDKEFLVRTNESTYIPAGHKHRLSNPAVLNLVMIEVQSGEYLGEDDIVRFDDKYGRS